MRRDHLQPALLIAAAVFAMLYGFVPTGAVALALALRALALGPGESHARKVARRWLVATLFIGALVEVPVIAHALV